MNKDNYIVQQSKIEGCGLETECTRRINKELQLVAHLIETMSREGVMVQL